MGLYKDESPLLSSSAAIDEGLGVETSLGSKIVGSWVENFQAPIATAAVDQAFYIAPYAVEIVAIRASWGVNSSSGNAIVEKLTGTTAVGSGLNAQTAVFDLAGANNAVNTATLNSTVSTRQFAAGDRIGINFAGTMTGLVGLNIGVQLKRI